MVLCAPVVLQSVWSTSNASIDILEPVHTVQQLFQDRFDRNASNGAVHGDVLAAHGNSWWRAGGGACFTATGQPTRPVC